MPLNTPASTHSKERFPKRDKKFIVVIGAESSGNRLIFRTIRDAGKYADDENKMVDWWNNPATIECDTNRITYRSLPHYGIGNGRKFVDPVAFGESAWNAGYDVRFVITTRDKTIVARSKTHAHTLGDAVMAESEMNETRAVLARLIEAHGDRCFLWSYETFMFLREDYLKSLYRWLGVNAEEFPELTDGNEKYLAGKNR